MCLFILLYGGAFDYDLLMFGCVLLSFLFVCVFAWCICFARLLLFLFQKRMFGFVCAWFWLRVCFFVWGVFVCCPPFFVVLCLIFDF